MYVRACDMWQEAGGRVSNLWQQACQSHTVWKLRLSFFKFSKKVFYNMWEIIYRLVYMVILYTLKNSADIIVFFFKHLDFH